MRQKTGLLHLPSLIVALILDIRCHNCGFQTASLLFESCSRCGYPSPPKFKCPNCGLHTARAKNGLCPKCGSPVAEVHAQPSANDTPLETEEIKAVGPVAESPPEPALPVEPLPQIEAVSHVVPEVIPNPPLNPAPIQVPAIDLKPPETVDNLPVIELPPPPPKTIPVLSEEFSVSMEQLAEIFKNDSAKADVIYKEKILRVKGTVEKIFIEDTENPYIVLGSSDPAVGQKVQCVFESKYLPALRRMTTGQKITALGKYSSFDTDVHLVECMPVG
ncbi:MAG: hypothetical protein PHY28_04960 [Dehalococcoidales bacterium]|nr:hypothetical protein [Dehalococcoidales bacterium]